MSEKNDDDGISTPVRLGLASDSSPPLALPSSSSPPNEPPAPPNGGLQAWSKVLGCFFIFFITWGIACSFGAYQAYYEAHFLSAYSASVISWIGTVQVFLLGMTGILWGALYDRGHIRPLLLAGCTLVVLGLFTLSLARDFDQIILAQGFCIGLGNVHSLSVLHSLLGKGRDPDYMGALGNGMIYVPSVAVVSNTFTSKRPIALGISATGAAVGGVVLPIMFRRLVPRIGFGWVNRIFGFMVLAMSVAAVLLLRPSPHPIKRHEGRLLDLSALKEVPYVFLLAGMFFAYLGYWIPLFYIGPYA